MIAFVAGVSAAFTVCAVTQPVCGVDVAEDRPRAGRRDRLGAGVERERRHDDVVAGPHAHRPQRDRQGLGPVGDADRVARAAVRGELALEGADLGAEDEATRVDHAGDRRVDLRAQRTQRRRGVEQRDGHALRA